MKNVFWIGSTKSDLRGFPEVVRQQVGFALHLAQNSEKAINTVPLIGFGGASVLEIVSNENGDTYRAVYAVQFDDAVYVLHAFKKKSKRGRQTPKKEMDIVRSRLKSARNHYEENIRRNEKQKTRA